MPCSLVEEHFAPKNASCIFKIYLNEEDGGSMLFETVLLFLYVGFGCLSSDYEGYYFLECLAFESCRYLPEFGGRQSGRFL